MTWVPEPAPVDPATATFTASVPARTEARSLPHPGPVPTGAVELAPRRAWVTDGGRLRLAALVEAVDPGPDPGLSLAVRDGRLVVVLPPGPALRVQLTLATRAVGSASWVTRSGERSLRVQPTVGARGWSDGGQEVFAELVALVPEADSPGMRDQLVCHVVFAPSKPAWFLEPRRPAVGYAATVAAACNPGDVADGG